MEPGDLRKVGFAMNHSKRKLTAGKDYDLLDNGVIVVRRSYDNLLDPYKKERIPHYLSQIDHSFRIERKKSYRKALLREETEFNTLVRELESAGRSLILVFQGRDAAGKSGAIIRLFEALGFDPKIFQWIPIGPPTDEELEHDYLWRFNKDDRMPKFGEVRAFDRSWAERVLVEPVMKITSSKLVRKSYAEIRAFEQSLVSRGHIVVKFWLDITPDEQLRRFRKRAANKPWKYSKADKEARKHWDDYTGAANEMFYRTGTQFAPWYVLSSEDKRYSRVTVLQVINMVLRAALR